MRSKQFQIDIIINMKSIVITLLFALAASSSATKDFTVRPNFEPIFFQHFSRFRSFFQPCLDIITDIPDISDPNVDAVEWLVTLFTDIGECACIANNDDS